MEEDQKRMMACMGSYEKMGQMINNEIQACSAEHGCTDLSNCPMTLMLESLGTLMDASNSCHVFYKRMREADDKKTVKKPPHVQKRTPPPRTPPPRAQPPPLEIEYADNVPAPPGKQRVRREYDEEEEYLIEGAGEYD